jgi:hypothetical protein
LKKLNGVEKDLVYEELAERMRDVVYSGADEKAREIEPLLSNIHEMPSDMPITFKYTIEFCVGDIKQIAGRKRRKGK